MTVREIIKKATEQFSESGIVSARLDADLLVGFVLKLGRAELIAKANDSATEIELKKIGEFISRRCEGEPVAYLLGEKDFYKYSFVVNPSVLVPRPETEIIVEEALRILPTQSGRKLMDFGCGSGCIGLSIIAENTGNELLAIDISDEAIGVAKENAKRLNLTNRVSFISSDIHALNAKDANFLGVELIVANPPYIDANDPNIERKTLRFEPSIALYSKDEGFRDPVGWAKKAADVLVPNGILLMEIGADQADRIQSNIRSWYRKISFLTDLAGFKRVVKAEK